MYFFCCFLSHSFLMPPCRPQKSAKAIFNSDDLLGLPILDVLDKLRNNPAPPQQSNGPDPELDEDDDKADDDRGDEVSQRTPSPPPSKPWKQKHTEAGEYHRALSLLSHIYLHPHIQALLLRFITNSRLRRKLSYTSRQQNTTTKAPCSCLTVSSHGILSRHNSFARYPNA